MTNRRNLNGVADAVRNAGSVALCAHVNPDGDTVGSTLALRLGLQQLGKQATVYCQDKIPDNLMFLPGAEKFLTPDQAQPADLLLTVDVSDMRRMGACSTLVEMCGSSAQIDHHGTNPDFTQVNDVAPEAPATALLAYELLSALGVPLNREIAMCLYAGVSTDTGNFAFNNTTAGAFDLMSELMRCDLPLAEMNRTLFRERSQAQIKLLSRALGSLQFHCGGRITSMVLTLQDFEDCGALPEHADTIVNFGLDVTGVRMAFLARESHAGGVKVSLRAVAPASIDDVAASLGGGGHAQAAGCTLQGVTLAQARAQVLSAMEAKLDGEQQA